MSYRTVESIIKASIGEAFKLYESIPTDFIKQAVNFYNASEPFIWRKWPWHNRKVDEITVTPDANGTIVFDGENSDVDVVRAVTAVGANGDIDAIVWNENEIRAAINGSDISSGTFQHLSDDDNGNRRIRVCVDDEVTAFKVLAFRRFIRAEVSEVYSSTAKNATPNDYRVLTWKIDRAEAPLIAYIADELKKWNGQEGTGKWNHGLNGTLGDLKQQQPTEQTVAPQEGAFGELGAWE